MAETKLIPKQRSLNSTESLNSFESWKESLLFHIIINPKLARYVDEADLGEWGAASVANRGFIDDAEAVPADRRMTANQKGTMLKILLGSVATYASVISHTFITKQATSLNQIFSRLRAFYGFRRTGAMITGALNFKLEPLETHEALWERIYSFIEGNLLTAESEIKHEDEEVDNDEEFSPTLLNITVIIWLNTIHQGLPTMVSQKFATTLRDVTIYSLRAEISESIPSMLQELEERDGTISYAPARGKPGNRRFQQKPRRKCCLCEAASRPGYDNHFLSSCPFLPPEDRKYMSKAKIREVGVTSESESEGEEPGASCKVRMSKSKPANIDRVDIVSTPVLQVTVNTLSAEITLDSGAESTLIVEDECHRLNLQIQPTSQQANMADGASRLNTIGEVHFTATRFCKVTKLNHKLHINGLVVKKLSCPILVGMPFLDQNDVYPRPAHKSICIGDCCIIKYSNHREKKVSKTRAASILRVMRNTCLLPGESLDLDIPQEYHGKTIAVEPRSITDSSNDWLTCKILTPTANSISVTNDSGNPVHIKRHEHICQIRHTTEDLKVGDDTLKPVPARKSTEVRQAAKISVDPHGILNESDKQAFIEINRKYEGVFSAQLGKYNGHSGPFEHIINMGASLPPQRKGRVPVYNKDNLNLLQSKFDELQSQGVFARPEDLGISAEYVSPSFLVAKSSGGHRLVTTFTEIGQYAKPQPSLMPKVDDVIRQLAQFEYIVQGDLRWSYYQVPLAQKSMKYVGVCTPYRGVLVYTRAVMGLPGSESALEQLLCKILGDLMVKGNVVKLADDIYVGANSPSELLEVWESTLNLLQANGLRLSPEKTVCCPKSTQILGWNWNQGKLSASPHRIISLTQCSLPNTVKELRSYIGSYKYLSPVLPRHSDVLYHLDKVCSSTSSSNEKIVWNTELEEAFIKSQQYLKSAETLTLPKIDDKIQITTDAAASTRGLAATMYVIRDKPYIAGVFNARKSEHQSGWLICEIEALAISAAVKHFGPYIAQSKHTTEVFTDSLQTGLQ